MNSGYLLNKPPSFNREGYNLWKEKIIIFIEEIHIGIQQTVKEDLFVPPYEVNGVVVNKYDDDDDDCTKDEKKKVQQNFKAKTIITTAFGLDEFLWVSRCETRKEM